jgi:hypothetical protein
MRRTTALTISVAVLLALPSFALALARVLHGPAGPGANAVIDLQFNIKKHHATKITRFEFANIPASCQGFSPTAVSDRFAGSIHVSSTGTFHAKQTVNAGHVTYTMSGHFINLHKATGKLRIKGAVAGCSSADTGTVHWTIKG